MADVGMSFETQILENATAHVMECSVCGGTYEHVNGDYEYCPHCKASLLSNQERNSNG